MNCLCPPPDYINVPGEHGFTDTILLKGFGTVLHGKKATTKCIECGIGLCVDCVGHVTVYSDDRTFYNSRWLCPSCKEVR